MKEIVKESVCRFIRIAFPLISLVQHPERAECVKGRACIVRLSPFRVGLYLADYLARFFQDNGKIVFGFPGSLLHFFFCFRKGIQLHTGKAIHCRFSQILEYICRVLFYKGAQKQAFCFDHIRFIPPQTPISFLTQFSSHLNPNLVFFRVCIGIGIQIEPDDFKPIPAVKRNGVFIAGLGFQNHHARL